LPPAFTERLDHRARGFLAAAVIICRDLRRDFHPGLVTGNIDGEDRDARLIRLLDDGHDRFRFTRTEHDRGNLAHDEILDLIALFRHVFIAAHDDRIESVLLSLCGDVVANHFKNGLSSVSSETPIVPRDFGSAALALVKRASVAANTSVGTRRVFMGAGVGFREIRGVHRRYATRRCH
jgi:hypothetical protein